MSNIMIYWQNEWRQCGFDVKKSTENFIRTSVNLTFDSTIKTDAANSLTDISQFYFRYMMDAKSYLPN